MVNGYLPPPRRQELFAGCGPYWGVFCPLSGAGAIAYHIVLFSLFPLARLLQFSPRSQRWKRLGRAAGAPDEDAASAAASSLIGESTDGECTSRRLIAADGAHA